MSHSILQDCELAFQAYLKTRTFTLLPAANIYKGIDHPSVTPGEQPGKVLPWAVCIASDGERYVFPTENYNVKVTLELCSSADDFTEAQHRTFVDEVLDDLETTTIASDLTGSLTGFTVFLIVPEDITTEIEERRWCSRRTYMLYCTGQDIV